MADAIGLIRHHRLTGKFVAKIDKGLQPMFREITEAIEAEK